MGFLIRASPLAQYRELVQELGGDPAPLLRRYRIPFDLADREDAFLPYRSLVELLEATTTALACPQFGLRLAARQGLALLGPIAVVARSEPTVLDAFVAMGKYLRVYTPALLAVMQLHKGKPGMRLNLEIIEPGLNSLSQAYENSTGVALQILKMLAGARGRPMSVSFPHQRVSSEKIYRDYFECPVRFGQDYCGFHLSPQVLSLKIASADPEVRRMAAEYLDMRIAAAGHTGDSAAESVGRLVRRLLSTGQCSIQTVAEHLCLHPRTLQRRLAEQGETFESLVDAERRAVAWRLLSDRRMSLTQITGLLGYAEQSAFNRSCRRWFNAGPREMRIRLSVNDSARIAR